MSQEMSHTVHRQPMNLRLTHVTRNVTYSTQVSDESMADAHVTRVVTYSTEVPTNLRQTLMSQEMSHTVHR
jgi:hypothetical protein